MTGIICTLLQDTVFTDKCFYSMVTNMQKVIKISSQLIAVYMPEYPCRPPFQPALCL